MTDEKILTPTAWFRVLVQKDLISWKQWSCVPSPWFSVKTFWIVTQWMELNEQHLNFLQNSDVFFNLKFIRKKKFLLLSCSAFLLLPVSLLEWNTVATLVITQVKKQNKTINTLLQHTNLPGKGLLRGKGRSLTYSCCDLKTLIS